MLSTVIILSVITLTTSCDILLDGDDSGTASLGNSFTLPTGTVQQRSENENNEIQITPWSQGEVTLYVVTLGAGDGPDNAEEIVHNDGTFPEIVIDEEGNFAAVTINAPPTETLLSTAEFNAFPDEQYSVTPRVFSFVLIGGFENPDLEIGVHRNVSTEDNTSIYWMYVDRDVMITGSQDFVEYDLRVATTTNLTLKQGWNRIIDSVSYSNNTLILSQKTGSEPPETGWFADVDFIR